MQRAPRAASAPLLSRFLVWRIFFVSVLFAAGALAIFFYGLWRGVGVETARTMVVNVIVVFEIFYLFNVRYLHMTSMTFRGALGTPAVLIALVIVVVAQFAFTYTPIMQALFESRPVALSGETRARYFFFAAAFGGRFFAWRTSTRPWSGPGMAPST